LVCIRIFASHPKNMKTKLKTLISITIVIILTIVFHFAGWLSPVENFLHSLVKPGSELMYSISVSENSEDVELFSNNKKLIQAYKDLKTELLENKINLAELQLLQEENQELKKQLNFVESNKYLSVGVNVIGKNTEPTGNTLIVDRGKKDNIELGNIVITEKGVLVGKITSVDDHFSIVRLINDNQSKIAGTIINQEKSIGLVEGGYGISVHMNFVPQNEILTVGDTVVTSGLEEGIPRGLLIGKIEAIEKEAYQPFQKAVISPFVNLEKIILASIIIDTDNSN